MKKSIKQALLLARREILAREPEQAERPRAALSAIREALDAEYDKEDGVKSPSVAAVVCDARPVIVCTDKRGVFFGYATKTDGDPIVIRNARMCVYWSADVKGITGLAANGPTKACRIAPPAPALELRGVTCVMDVTEAAAKLWESAPWQS